MDTTQGRLTSLVEACLNVGSGFFVSMAVWQLIAAPLYGYEVTLVQNVGLTSIFTVASLLRSYIWRRFFAVGMHRTVVNWIGRVK